MAKDPRQLREEAANAAAAGKHKRALDCYLELERAEPSDAQWPKRAAEMWRRLGKNKDAVGAYERAVSTYAARGFTPQAVALCKLALQIDPTHEGLVSRLAALAPEPTRTSAPHLEAKSGGAMEGLPISLPSALRKDSVPSSPAAGMALAMPTPFAVPPHAAAAGSGQQAHATAHRAVRAESPQVSRVNSSPRPSLGGVSRPFRAVSEPSIAVESDDELAIDEVDMSDELELHDLEELVSDEGLSAAALSALETADILRGLSPEARETLAGAVRVDSLASGAVIFEEGDRGDALYIVSEGEVVMRASGPPPSELGRFRDGTAFGELSLVTDQPRPATAVAASACELIVVDREALAALLAAHPDAPAIIMKHIRERLVERLLRTSALFRPFTEPERRDIAGRFRVIEVEDGVRVLAPGSRPDGLYIVLAGLVNVSGGNSALQLGAGDLLGEVSLLTNEKLPYAVESVGKCWVMQLPRMAFQELIMTHPQLLEYVGEQAEARKRVQMI